jgi:alkanesulfonate monooxygenase
VAPPVAARKLATLVGTPETVAKALLEYDKLGATSLLIRGYDPRPDAIQYGEELIPRLRELVTEYDAASRTAGVQVREAR